MMDHPLLQYQVENKEYSHAYLFEGNDLEAIERDSLKLAESIVTDQGKKTELLEKFRHDNLGDFLKLIPKKKNISIDEIREVIRFFSTSPLESPYKVAYIPNAHKMGNEAANALLKTLEEPADFGILILTTLSKTMLLPTVVSRCRLFSYSKENGEGILIKKDINSILVEVLLGNLLIVPKSKEILESHKDEKEELLNYIEGFLGDLFLCQRGLFDQIEYPENNEDYEKLLKIQNIDKMIIKSEHIRRNFKVNANYQLSMEELFIYMMEVANGRSSWRSF